MSDVMFFDPSKEADIKRRRRMAEQLQANASQPNPTQVVSGIAVQQSPLEGLARALQMGIGGYQEGKADNMETELAGQRQKMMAEAVNRMGTDPQGAANILLQDPKMATMGMKLYSDALNADRQNVQRGQQFDNQMKAAAVRSGQAIYDPATGELKNNPSGNRKLSSTEQKQFFDQNTIKQSAQQSQKILDQIDEIRKEKMYTGAGSTILPALNRVPFVGDYISDKKSGNTTSYNNLLKEMAYSKLKATFPGQISNSERQALENLQALSSYSKSEQDKILAESRKILQRLENQSQKTMEGISSGNIYNDSLGATVQDQGAPPQIQPVTIDQLNQPQTPNGMPIPMPSANLTPIQQPPSERDQIIEKLKANGVPDDRIQQFLQSKGL